MYVAPKEKQITVFKANPVKAGLAVNIIGNVHNSGLHQQEQLLANDETSEFYNQHENSDHFEELTEFMSNGPCMSVVLSKGYTDVRRCVINKFRELIGLAYIDRRS